MLASHEYGGQPRCQRVGCFPQILHKKYNRLGLGWVSGLPVAAAAVFIQLLQSRRPRWLADTGTL